MGVRVRVRVSPWHLYAQRPWLFLHRGSGDGGSGGGGGGEVGA